MEISNIGEYHDLYLVSDVLLLGDVFENFRKVAYRQCGLEVLHYYTHTGL